MSDVKEQLQTYAAKVMHEPASATMLEALAYIERLEAENERLRGLIRTVEPYLDATAKDFRTILKQEQG
jgi:hypothetical protein